MPLINLLILSNSRAKQTRKVTETSYKKKVVEVGLTYKLYNKIVRNNIIDYVKKTRKSSKLHSRTHN